MPADQRLATPRLEANGALPRQELSVVIPASQPIPLVVVELDLFPHELAEHRRCLCCLQTAVEIDGGLDVAVAEQTPHRLIVTRVILEIDRGSGMPELM